MQGTTAAASVSWAAGSTYKLCGTLTSALSVGASGTAGNLITVSFETGSSIAMPYCPSTGCINLGGHSYITIHGNSVGSVGSTNNGSASLGYAYQQNGYGVYGSGANTNLLIDYLSIGPIYTHDNTGNDTNGNGTAEVYIQNSSSNSAITIDHNILHDSDFGLQINASNYTVSNNLSYNNNWTMLLGCTTYTTCSHVWIFGNTAYGFNKWDTLLGTSFHHNFVHAYGDSTSTVNYVYEYNNSISGDSGDSFTGWILFSEITITLNYIYAFNNRVIASYPANGAFFLYSLGGDWLLANNTIIGAYPTGSEIQGNCIAVGGAINGIIIENNVVSNCGGSQVNLSAPVPVSPIVDYNVYAQVNPSASYPWGYAGAQIYTLSAWRKAGSGTCPSGGGFDCHGSYTEPASAVLHNSTGAIVENGPARGKGVNLYSTCKGQLNPGLGALCYDAAGVARPASGPWDAGAYQTRPVPPPITLHGQVRYLRFFFLN
jgi:hypothetical protein